MAKNKLTKKNVAITAKTDIENQILIQEYEPHPEDTFRLLFVDNINTGIYYQ